MFLFKYSRYIVDDLSTLAPGIFTTDSEFLVETTADVTKEVVKSTTGKVCLSNQDTLVWTYLFVSQSKQLDQLLFLIKNFLKQEF